jgi:hypothetical protein
LSDRRIRAKRACAQSFARMIDEYARAGLSGEASTWYARACKEALFNSMRALVEEQRGGEALALIERAGIEEKVYRDGALVAGQWARLCREIHREAGRSCPDDVQARAERLDRSQAPQAWLYRLNWALCPIPFYEPPPPVFEPAEPETLTSKKRGNLP